MIPAAARSDAGRSRAGVYSWDSAPRGERRTLRIASAVAQKEKRLNAGTSRRGEAPARGREGALRTLANNQKCKARMRTSRGNRSHA